MLEASGGGVTVRSNIVAGGAVWEWRWNGFQFINTYDYGREMQSAAFWEVEPGVWANPTEAGDGHSAQSQPGFRHGSPMHSFSLSYGGLNNQNVTSSSIETRCVPLEWDPSLHGGSTLHPVIWKDVVIGKDLIMNFNGMGPVAKYITYFSTPTSLPIASIEIPTAYLNGEFNRYWVYNAQTKTLTQPPMEYGVGGSSGAYGEHNVLYGGVIISNAAETAALGIYGVQEKHGGSVSYYTLWNFTEQGGTGQYSPGTSKMAAVFGPGKIESGVTRFNSYICTGTVSDVAAQMNSLYKQGVR
jgi:hypothetical protein